MENLPDHNDTVEPLLFNPRELDLSQLPELSEPEINIAAVTGIPSWILRLGYDRTKPTE